MLFKGEACLSHVAEQTSHPKRIVVLTSVGAVSLPCACMVCIRACGRVVPLTLTEDPFSEAPFSEADASA